MPEAKWAGLSDDEIAAELERKQVAVQRAKGTARRVAWYATFLCVITLIAMAILAWINRRTLPMPWTPFALIPFLSFLPVVFFRVAAEQRQMENQLLARTRHGWRLPARVAAEIVLAGGPGSLAERSAAEVRSG